MFILVINPGSTSTKIAIFEDAKSIFQKTIRYTVEELDSYPVITDQYSFRNQSVVSSVINDANFDISQLNCVIGRGGMLKPIGAGIYEVNEAMLSDLRNNKYGEHASNLGALIAHEVASGLNDVKAYIADPVVVDELEDVARISGHPLLKRASVFHALNQRAVARHYARGMGTDYEKLRLIVAHLGGGVSVGAHRYGKVIDVNDGLNGDGPFSPERAGGLPAWPLAQLCFSGEYSAAKVKKMITGKGGYVAYFGTNDAREIENRALNGDERAALIENALAYQVAKEIGAMATVLEGRVDAIIITGGVAYGEPITKAISDRISFIAPVKVYPGEDEMRALAENALMLYRGKQELKIYV
ncbi:MAG: butyrate kinase [Bacteroidales bacterium]|jgi:butyrate kinase|nr:butyrate kinase [Bacteroidales bacterium]